MRVIASTLPKSGTHLLKHVLKGVGLRPHHPGVRELGDILAAPDGAYVLGHRPYLRADADAIEAAGITMVGLVRDPRDFIVSLAHHRLRTEPGDLPSMLTRLVSGSPSSFERALDAFYGWQTDARCLILRFEELIGPRGGGTQAAQLAAGRRLRDHLGLPLGDDEMLAAIVAAYRPDAGQFRRAEIGSWKDELPTEIAALLNGVHADRLSQWGYQAAAPEPAAPPR